MHCRKLEYLIIVPLPILQQIDVAVEAQTPLAACEAILNERKILELDLYAQ